MAEALILKMGGGVSSDELTAKKAQVLEGYTAVTTDSGDEGAEGTMPEYGELNWSASNTTKTVKAGHYTGGTLDSRPSYNKGMSDADARVNTSSESYKQGVSDADARVNTDSASYTSGYSKGVSDADATVNTSSASYKNGYSAGVAAADARVNTSSASYKKGYQTGHADGIEYADSRVNDSSENYNAGYEANQPVLVGSGSGNGTVDIRSVVTNYANLKESDFLITISSVYATADTWVNNLACAQQPAVNVAPKMSYDSSSGIITVSNATLREQVSDTDEWGGSYWLWVEATVSYNIYAFNTQRRSS